MLKSPRSLILVLLLLLAVAVATGIWFTGSAHQAATTADRKRAASWQLLVDQQPLQIAQQLEKLAVTREEARSAAEIVNLADHAVDLAFTTALRDAKDHPAAETPETRQLHDRVRRLQAQVADDEELVRQLSSTPAGRQPKDPEVQQQRLMLAAAEMALHRDELEDAQNDLIRSGGDPESRIKRLFNQHQATQHASQAQPVAFWTKPTFQVPANFLAQLRMWIQLRSRQQLILQAQRQTTASVAALNARHQDLEQRLAKTSPAAGSATSRPTPPASEAAVLAALQRQSEDRKTLAEYGSRIQDLQQVAQLYGDWAGVVGAQMLACIHGMLLGMLWVVIIVLLILAGDTVVDKLSARLATDRRRMATMRLLGHFAVQGVGVVVIIFVLVGSPNQLSTVIALAGAGLTVALKDFIVAFFGWFVLMGKNGIRVGDWVEINGIVGEVVDIGLLRTTVLETGNWAESGHPTGRRVSFVNSFAIEGHFFNFSTTGQWLWDTMEIQVPPGLDPYSIMDAVLQLIQKETESTARIAAQEWQHATRGSVKGFSAEPAINLRPRPGGVAIVVRYIARANDRFSLRSRLYQYVVDLLHQRQRAAAEATAKATEAGQ